MNKLVLFLLLFIVAFMNATAEDFPRTRPNGIAGPVKVFVSFLEGLNN